MSREMVNARWAQFKANTKAFFKSPEGSWNRQAIIAILIAGFVGWLLLTVTVGARIKRALKKVPGIKMLFKQARTTYRRAASNRQVRRGARMVANAKRRK